MQSGGGVSKRGPFERLGLSGEVARAATKLGFALPTPIQRRAVPAIVSNTGDVVVNARTGSGKTAAFLLPLLHRLERHSAVVGARGLVISPTRELAMQTGLVLRKMLTRTGIDLRVCYLVGGMSMTKQFEHLSSNPDILICTPGRLVHHMVEVDYELTKVELAVFDEADTLFEMGFEDDIRHILRAMKNAEKQCVLLSATMPPRLVGFAKTTLFNPQYVQLDTENRLPDTLAIQLFFVRQPDKTAALLYWLDHVMDASATCIIFCSTAYHVSFLGALLETQGVKATQISGQLTQVQRDEAMRDFTRRTSRVLIATDVAARGLDIPNLDYVVHYSFPSSAKLFIHRSGRTARNNKEGTCVSFVTREEFPYLLEVLLFVGRKLKQEDPEDPLALDIGGLPDINEYRDITSSTILGDPAISAMLRSANNGEIQYMKHRQPASKRSMKRAGELDQALGGCITLADKVHPALADYAKSTQRIIGNIARQDTSHGLDSILTSTVKKEEYVAATLEGSDALEKTDLRGFKPNKHMAIGSNIVTHMRDMLTSKRMVSEAAKAGLASLSKPKQKKEEDDAEFTSDEEDEVMVAEDSRPASKPRLSAAARRKLKQGISAPSAVQVSSAVNSGEQFVLRSEQRDDVTVAREMGISLNGGALMAHNAFSIMGDDEENMKKTKKVMKWNATRKKYELMDIDRSGKRVKTDSGATAKVSKKRLYEKWTKQTDSRVQGAGEREDEHLVKQFRLGRRRGAAPEAVEPAPLSELTGNKALLEKIERKLPMTAKEQRRHRALLKRQANPIVSGTTANGVRQTRKQRRNATKARQQSQKVFEGAVRKRMKNRKMPNRKRA